jgi:hypothetical protein
MLGLPQAMAEGPNLAGPYQHHLRVAGAESTQGHSTNGASVFCGPTEPVEQHCNNNHDTLDDLDVGYPDNAAEHEAPTDVDLMEKAQFSKRLFYSQEMPEAAASIENQAKRQSFMSPNTLRRVMADLEERGRGT